MLAMTDQQDLHPDVLVLGATGKTGRRIADRLTARGVAFRAGSRSARPRFDWDDRATWPAVLDGVRAVYVAYFPDLAVPGAAETVEAFARLAVGEHGVERLVLLSGRGEDEAQRTEELVRAVLPTTTVLRASWFAQNFSESFVLDGVLSGEVVLPVDAVREPFVDADDIADVAVAALTEAGHEGQLYELTGPRLMTFADAVADVAAATGRDLRFVSVPVDAYAAGARDAGVAPDELELITYLFTEVLDGRNERLADGVQRALGRAPRDFADYARATAATGAWAVPATA